MYILKHFYVHLKLTQHYKSTTILKEGGETEAQKIEAACPRSLEGCKGWASSKPVRFLLHCVLFHLLYRGLYLTSMLNVA